MATRTTKPKRDDDLLANWESIPERAPSIVKADTPTLTRALAMISLLLTAIGGIAMVAPNFGLHYVITPGAHTQSDVDLRGAVGRDPPRRGGVALHPTALE